MGMVFILDKKELNMRTILKYTLPLAGMLLFAACGDDSSSSPAQNSEKFILDEANQKFAIIYDRCYTSETTTRWDENVDTSWFHYKFVRDTLIVFKDGNTADGHYGEDYDANKKLDGGEIFVGGKSGSIFGTWKTLKERCYYEDGEIDCDDYDKEDGENESFFVLDVSKNSLAFSWEMNKNICFADEYAYTIEELLLYDFNIDEDDLSVSNSDCNTIKIRANGKTVTATTSVSISKDNVATRDIVYTSGDKTCQSTFKKVDKLLQQPESLCNEKDMAKYMRKEATYPHKYQVDNDEEFYPCLAEMLGVDYGSDEDYED